MKIDKTQNILIALNSILGIKITLDDVYSLLGVIILSIQLILIIIKAIVKIHDKLKKDDVNGIVDDVNKAIEDINALKPNKKDGDKDGRQ